MSSNQEPDLNEVIKAAVERVGPLSDDPTLQSLSDPEQVAYITNFLDNFDVYTVSSYTVNVREQTLNRDSHLLYYATAQRVLLVIEGRSLLWVGRTENGEPTTLRLVGEWAAVQLAMDYWLDCSFMV